MDDTGGTRNSQPMAANNALRLSIDHSPRQTPPRVRRHTELSLATFIPEDPSEPLSVTQLKYLAKSRLLRHAISCPITFGGKVCDAVLATNGNFEQHLLRTHLGEVHRLLDEEEPVPVIRWGSWEIKWDSLKTLKSELKLRARRQADSSCVLAACKRPQISGMENHYQNAHIHPPQPWTAANLYPEATRKPPTMSQLPPLPPPQPPYLISCPPVQPYRRGGPEPLIAHNPLLNLDRPRSERYLPLRDPTAPFLAGSSGLPDQNHFFSISSDIFPDIGRAEFLSQDPDAPDATPLTDREPSYVPSSPTGSNYSISQDLSSQTPLPTSPLYRRTRAHESLFAEPPLPPLSRWDPPATKPSRRPGFVVITSALHINPLPDEIGPIPTASTPGRSLRITPRTIMVPETLHPTQQIYRLFAKQAEDIADREQRFKRRREASARDEERKKIKQGEEQTFKLHGSSTRGIVKQISPVTYRTKYRRPRPTSAQLEAAAELYAVRKTGEMLGADHWKARMEYQMASLKYVEEIEREGGWID